PSSGSKWRSSLWTGRVSSGSCAIPKGASGSCLPSTTPGTTGNHSSRRKEWNSSRSPGITRTCSAYHFEIKGGCIVTAEHVRLDQARDQQVPWKRWGPYLSERQWGTVREDYSEGGDAWNYFTHDQARSRAYRWGEDGLAGISDDQQHLCYALAVWNGKDPILKERLFGLTNSEGNHGEDVKEYYFY